MDAIKNVASKIQEYQKELRSLSTPPAGETDRKQFALLLSGISTCRKVPGIPVHMGYETLYHCETEEDASKARNHLQQIYGISDAKSLLDTCKMEYSSSTQYEHFMSFWVGEPLFSLEQLTEEGRERFLESKEKAEMFFPIVREKGFYAWDINEKIGLCRKAVACGIISEEEFWEYTDPWVRQAQVFYHSFQEYAISCLCGAVYFMGVTDTDIENFFQINYRLVAQLLDEGGAWRRTGWYLPREREWVSWLGDEPGCLITNRALAEEQIGYMYREEPIDDFPDCGWRFFVGDETEDYINQVENIAVVNFNDVCNIDPTILAYFYAKPGSSFGKTLEGDWVRE
ncbi:MAG: DUF2185 domain-containing protein [Lachnospiraceae bacterium]|nr:DUF2185 domain-containing protein [Lachnospiraceae bacterium]